MCKYLIFLILPIKPHPLIFDLVSIKPKEGGSIDVPPDVTKGSSVTENRL